MIVLCANCHGRKKSSSDPRQINAASLTRIKRDLMMLNARYSDLERRLIENFKTQLDRPPHTTADFYIHESLIIMVHYLLADGIAALKHHSTPLPADGTRRQKYSSAVTINLTPKGREFVMGLSIRPRD